MLLLVGVCTDLFFPVDSPPSNNRYQIRFLLETPLAVNAGQHVEGTLKMEARRYCLFMSLLNSH